MGIDALDCRLRLKELREQRPEFLFAGRGPVRTFQSAVKFVSRQAQGIVSLGNELFQMSRQRHQNLIDIDH